MDGMLISDFNRLTASAVMVGISYFIYKLVNLELNICTKILVLRNSFK
jgi:hypothetical protein